MNHLQLYGTIIEDDSTPTTIVKFNTNTIKENIVMRSIFGKKDFALNVLIVTDNHCIPGRAPFDEKYQLLVETALSQTNLTAKVNVIPPCSAYCGCIPKDILNYMKCELKTHGNMNLPVIMINGKAVSCGEPNIETLKLAFINAKSKNKKK